MFDFFRGTNNAQAIAALRMLDDLEALTEEEGSTVTFRSDNAVIAPLCSIDVCGSWTGWCTRRFEGHTRAKCLSKARRTMDASK